ncbi:MAG: Protein-export rane protein SecG [Ignavibacteria bacterium]|nr:Protein-export rane protein SecG [Ignavibacteria bacterium]
MLTLTYILLLIASVLLVLLVLLQPGKGDISSSFGGLTSQFSSILGTRKAADFLTKLTIGFAAGIMFLSLVANLAFVGKIQDSARPVTEGIELPATPATPNMPAPKASPKTQQKGQQPQGGQPQQKK